MESPPTQRTWTTARCNRLLRPLSSKLALLRKELPQQTAEKEGARVDPKSSISSSSFPVQAKIGKEVVCEESTKIDNQSQDLEPSPRPLKRIKRTYSCRGVGADIGNEAVRSTFSQSQIEPSIRFPSYRLLVDQHSRQSKFPNDMCAHFNPSNHSFSTMKGPKHNALRHHVKFAYPDSWKLIEGIHNGLDTLLRATANGVKTAPTGSRTLFSTCLRKAPDYIAAEEIWCKEEDPESTVDISSAIYNDLEALGVSSSGGWKPLREVVRAHGIALLGAAVKDRAITSLIARGLVLLCIAHSAFDEGQQLIECMISTMEPLKPPTNTRSSLFAISHLGMLDYFTRISGRYGFQYRELTSLFSKGILSIEWMSTHEMIPCWNRLIGSVAEGNYQVRDAAVLLRTVLSLSYGVSYPSLSSQIHNIRLRAGGSSLTSKDKPSYRSKTSKVNHLAKEKSSQQENPKSEDMANALRSTSSHLLTIITTLDFLQTSAFSLKSNHPSPASASVLQDVAFEAHQALEADQKDEGFGETSQIISYQRRLCLPLLAAAVVAAANDQDGVELNQDICRHFDLIRLLKPGDDFADTAASFILAIVNCCGQAESSEAFHYTQRIIKGLTQSSICQSLEPEARRLSEKIAVKAAVQFSKITGSPKHLTWALDLELVFNRKTVGADGQTPIRPSAQTLTKTKSSFMWEEGICEWVAGTPVIPVPKSIVYKQQDDIVPSLSGDSRAVVAEKSSPFKPLPSLVEVSPASIKCNSAATPSSASLEKPPSGSFWRVEIDNSHRIKAGKVHGCMPPLLEVSPRSIKSNNAATPSSASLEKPSSGSFWRVEIDNSHRTEAGNVHMQAPLLEVSPRSIKSSNAAKTSSGSLEKSSSGSFWRVQIDNSHRTEARNVHGCTIARENSDSIPKWKTTAAKDQEITIGEPSIQDLSQRTATSNDSTLDQSSPRVEYTKTRGQKRRHRVGKRKGSWVLTEPPEQAPDLGYVEGGVMSVESEDELSFA